MKHFILILALASAGLAQAATYELELPGVPADTRAACHEQVMAMSGAFAAATQVTILGAECEREDYTRGGYEATLTYVADRSLARPVVVQDRLYSPYESGAACRDDLQSQVDVFRSQTGLSPLFAYCSPDGYQYIHAHGEPVRQPRWFHSHLLGEFSVFDVWVENPAGVVQDVVAGLAPYVDVVARAHMHDERLSVLYYADEYVTMEFVTDFGYPDGAECASQLPRFVGILRQFGGDPVASFCMSTEFYPHPEQQPISLVVSNMGTFYGQIDYLYKFEDPLEHADLAACQAAIPTRQAFYEGLGFQVYAALCGMIRDTQDYRITLYRRER